MQEAIKSRWPRAHPSATAPSSIAHTHGVATRWRRKQCPTSSPKEHCLPAKTFLVCHQPAIDHGSHRNVLPGLASSSEGSPVEKTNSGICWCWDLSCCWKFVQHLKLLGNNDTDIHLQFLISALLLGQNLSLRSSASPSMTRTTPPRIFTTISPNCIITSRRRCQLPSIDGCRTWHRDVR